MVHPLIPTVLCVKDNHGDLYTPKEGTDAEKWINQYEKYYNLVLDAEKDLHNRKNTTLEDRTDACAACCWCFGYWTCLASSLAPQWLATKMIWTAASCCLAGTCAKNTPDVVHYVEESKYKQAKEKLLQLIEEKGFESFECVNKTLLGGKKIRVIHLN